MKYPTRTVLIIAYDWSPSAEIGAVRVEKIACELDSHGIKPVVLTVRESNYENSFSEVKKFNFPIVRTRAFPNPVKGYQFLKKQLLKILGVKTIGPQSHLWSVEKSSTDSKSKLPFSRFKRTILSLLYMPDEFQGWIPFGIVKAIRIIKAHNIPFMITSGPPFTTHLVGLIVKKWNGANVTWIADFRDPWVANEQRPTELTTPISHVLNRLLEKQVINHADHVVCVTPAMTDWYKKRYPLVRDNAWQTITNGFDREEFYRTNVEKVTGKFTISYVGSIEYERNPIALLHAVAELCMEGVFNADHVSVRFVGRCGSVNGRSTAEIIESYGLQHLVTLVGALPREQALQEMKRSHVLLLLANAQRLQVPGKAYEYMAAGGFILAVTEESGATADLIRRVGGGLIIAPGDHESIKHVLRSRYEAFVRSPSQTQSASMLSRSLETLERYEWKYLGHQYALILQ